MQKFLVGILFLLSGLISFSQEFDPDEILKTIVEVENPVYKPVLGFGTGFMNYYGDIKGASAGLTGANPSFRFSVSMFADEKQYFKFNFIANVGGKFGKNIVITDPATQADIIPFSSFKTDIYSLGINFEYNYKHIFKRESNKKIRPFTSVGIEFLNFTAKGDLSYPMLVNKQYVATKYYPWTDGTLRNYDQNSLIDNPQSVVIVNRDNIFEENYANLYNFNQTGFTIPLDFGLDLYLGTRATLRFGASYNFTFSDYLDGYKPTSDNNFLNNDRYLLSYTTFSYDLWSDAKFKEEIALVADLGAMGYDYNDAWDDSDGDMTPDFIDQCPETPWKVPVDSVGCPFDDDGDGIPNYLDKEPNTAPGAYVDKEGRTLTEDQLIALLNWDSSLNREEAFKAGNYKLNKYQGVKNLKIPEKFKFVDANGDGYISFFELLQAIDNYFDYNSNLTSEDLEDLNDFFFAQ